MKLVSGIILFLVVFFAVGIAMHFALYSKPGVFVWSVQQGAEGSSSVVRTGIDGPNEESSVTDPDLKSVDSGDATKGGEQANGDNKGEGQKAVSQPPKDPNLHVLFDGKDLGEWKKTQFGGEGDVFVNEEGNLEFGFGAVMTGVHWGGDVPATSNYEITFDAMKLDGQDFFCALTFPVKESHATFVIGGWGGGVVGISSVDDLNASENETMNIEGFENDVWYKIRVRVTDDRLDAWINEDHMVDLELKDRKISLLPGDVELCVPIGLASYITRAQYRNIEWRNIPEGE